MQKCFPCGLFSLETITDGDDTHKRYYTAYVKKGAHAEYNNVLWEDLMEKRLC